MKEDREENPFITLIFSLVFQIPGDSFALLLRGFSWGFSLYGGGGGGGNNVSSPFSFGYKLPPPIGERQQKISAAARSRHPPLKPLLSFTVLYRPRLHI